MMLGGPGYGPKRSKTSIVPKLLAVATLVLAVTTSLAGWGYISSRRSLIPLRLELQALQSQVTQRMEELSNQKMRYAHLEYDHQTTQRSLQDTSRRLREKDMELQQRDHALNQHNFEKDNLANKESMLKQTVDELQDQVNYERAIVEAHKQKVAQLEIVHRNRETDWHELSLKWKAFEDDAIQENTRLLADLMQCRNASDSGPPHPTKTLPDEEPLNRPETAFNINVQLPPKEDYIHPHHQQASEGTPLPSPQQDQQQASQPSLHGSDIGMQGIQGVPSGHHDPHAASLHAAQGMQPAHEGHVPIHNPPIPHNAHHGDFYDDHHWGHHGHYDEHLDPLDHYWVDDHIPNAHDNFHGEHWQEPPHPDDHNWNHHYDHYDQHHHHVPDPHANWDGAPRWEDNHAAHAPYTPPREAVPQPSHHWDGHQWVEQHWNDPSHPAHREEERQHSQGGAPGHQDQQGGGNQWDAHAVPVENHMPAQQEGGRHQVPEPHLLPKQGVAQQQAYNGRRDRAAPEQQYQNQRQQMPRAQGW